MSLKNETDQNALRVAEVYTYDRDTGAIKRKKRIGRKPCSVKKKASPAYPYRLLMVDGLVFIAHRVAWLLATGAWPKGVIDHLDGNTRNNRISNLRDVSCAVNSQNRRAPKVGKQLNLPICVFYKNSKYIGVVRTAGMNHKLGPFKTKESAEKAVLEFRRLFVEGNTL